MSAAGSRAALDHLNESGGIENFFVLSKRPRPFVTNDFWVPRRTMHGPNLNLGIYEPCRDGGVSFSSSGFASNVSAVRSFHSIYGLRSIAALVGLSNGNRVDPATAVHMGLSTSMAQSSDPNAPTLALSAVSTYNCQTQRISGAQSAIVRIGPLSTGMLISHPFGGGGDALFEWAVGVHTAAVERNAASAVLYRDWHLQSADGNVVGRSMGVRYALGLHQFQTRFNSSDARITLNCGMHVNDADPMQTIGATVGIGFDILGDVA
jgi:hypothetical protein